MEENCVCFLEFNARRFPEKRALLGGTGLSVKQVRAEPGVEIRIVDDSGVTSHSDSGKLWIKSPTPIEGYLYL